MGTFINNRAKETTQTQHALDTERAKPENQRDPALMAALQQRLQDNTTWNVGGAGRTIVIALNLAAGSQITGTAAQMLQGTAAQGQGCGAGATGAAAVINNLLDRANGTGIASLSAAEKQQRTDTVTSLVAGINAAAGGETAVSSAAARLETENNAAFVPVLFGALWITGKMVKS